MAMSLVSGCHLLDKSSTETADDLNKPDVSNKDVIYPELSPKEVIPYKFHCPAIASQDGRLEKGQLTAENFGIHHKHLKQSSAQQEGLLEDEFKNQIITSLRANPASANCIANQTNRLLDRKSVAQMIGSAAALNQSPITEIQGLTSNSFEDIITELCEGECEVTEGKLSEDISQILSPLIAAIQQGIYSRVENIPGGAKWWHNFGGNGLLLSENEPGYNPSIPEYRSVLNADQTAQYQAAAQIAFEVEQIDWNTLAQTFDGEFSVSTPFGWIRILGKDSDYYGPETDDTVLLIDLGGDDVHLGQVASNRSSKNPVSIVIDVAGDDRYDVPEDENLRRQNDDPNAPSLSKHYTQGSAQYGIAMLFDLAGDDVYRSYRASQGYAHFGVGVLYDGEGNDEYIAEAASQGAAQFGIALAIDAGEGNDHRSSYTMSQGFAYVSAVGILHDEGGDDEYHCDIGDAKLDGTARYPSPQLKDASNTSLCQGSALGLRNQNPEIAMSGGIGILRDQGGNDSYRASVYAQGSGYWQGTGMLLDGNGYDTYDALYYAQGVGVHFAAGIHLDQGKQDDSYGLEFTNLGLSLGAGHDFGIGVQFNEGGNDHYKIEKYSAGGTSCNGRGLFVDLGGQDTYLVDSIYSLGLGNAGECADTREQAPSIGVMLDAEGHDQYIYSDQGEHKPGNGRSWMQSMNERADEIGVGIDSDGSANVAQWHQTQHQSRRN